MKLSLERPNGKPTEYKINQPSSWPIILFLLPSDVTVRFTRLLLTNGIRTWQFHDVVVNQIGNFLKTCEFHAELRCEVAKFVASEVHATKKKFTSFGPVVGLARLLQMNPFTLQGKAISSSVGRKLLKAG